MLKYLLSACVLLSTCISAYSAQWVDAIKFATISSVERTFDGGYAAIGTKLKNNSNDRDVLFVRLNSAGELQWAKTYSVTGHRQSGSGILQTPDGGFLFTTEGASVVKVDPAGNVLWQKTFSCGGLLIAAADGGFFLVDSKSYLKSNLDGTVLWQKRIFGAGSIYSAVATSDGGFIFAGSWGIWPMTAKISPAGDINWQKVYRLGVKVDPRAKYHDQKASTIGTTADGGYVVGGLDRQAWGWHGYYGHTLGWVVKLDLKGNPSWQSIFDGGIESVTSLRQERDGHILIMGESNGTTGRTQGSGIWTARLDSTGNLFWQRRFGTETANDAVFGIHDTPRDGTVFVGYRWVFLWSSPQYRYDGLIGRTSPDGNVCNEFTGSDPGISREAVSIKKQSAHLEVRSTKFVETPAHLVQAPVKLNMQNLCDTNPK